jgi:carbamoyl-phosphate synthase large subunit
VLVLAVGGNVGQGILKALALSSLPCRVVGADVNPMKLGLYTADHSLISPWAEDERFVPWLVETCRKANIHAVLSGAEAILPILARERRTIFDETGAIVVVSPAETLLTCDDKLLTCAWLERNGFACPAYAASEQHDKLHELVRIHSYPLVAKPRLGGGCRGLVMVHDGDDLEYVMRKKGYIVQQHIGDDEHEYTAGCFSDRDGRVRGAMVMRRELHEGTTVLVEAGDYPEVREAAARIAGALRPMGPSNIQMRLLNGRPACFEINPRFSGTTPVRARMGFNDVEATLRHFVLGEPAMDLPGISEGIMLRYWNEMYVSPEARRLLEHGGALQDPHAFRVVVEDYGAK